MTSPTHVTFAVFIYLLILTTMGVSLSLINAIVLAISSVLPDIDTAASVVGRIVPFISTRIERRLGHRTFTHSLPFMLAIALLLAPLCAVNASLYVCLISGYASHPFLDTMTVNGVRLFYPFANVKCVFPFEVNNPHRYRIQTGSKGEKTLAALLFIGCIPTSMIAYEGYERFVRAAQQNIEAAVRDYNEFSRDHLVLANVTAYSALTRQPFLGTVEVIGALNSHTLVFKGADGRPHTLGKEFQADYVVENILCSRGAESYSSVRNIDLSNQSLAEIVSYTDTMAENYFFGDLTTSEKISLPENIRMFTPVAGSGGTIKLNFATYGDIREYSLEDVSIAKGILTIKSITRHRDGIQGGAKDEIPPRPERFVRIAITLDAGESIAILREQGDTLREKDLLARKGLDTSFGDRIRLNREKIALLLNQRDAAMKELGGKIANAEQSVRIESTEHARNLELAARHFAPAAVVEASRLKWMNRSQELRGLITSRSTLREKSTIAIRALEVENAALSAKAASAALKSEIRSSTDGILAGIRRSSINNKTQVTFIIRRFR